LAIWEEDLFDQFASLFEKQKHQWTLGSGQSTSLLAVSRSFQSSLWWSTSVSRKSLVFHHHSPGSFTRRGLDWCFMQCGTQTKSLSLHACSYFPKLLHMRISSQLCQFLILHIHSAQCYIKSELQKKELACTVTAGELVWVSHRKMWHLTLHRVRVWI
jgi:hypothetical protein